MASKDDRVYPGHIDRYRELRELRESLHNADPEGPVTGELAAVTVAEELAGLAYILDGIRYSARQR